MKKNPSMSLTEVVADFEDEFKLASLKSRLARLKKRKLEDVNRGDSSPPEPSSPSTTSGQMKMTVAKDFITQSTSDESLSTNKQETRDDMRNMNIHGYDDLQSDLDSDRLGVWWTDGAGDDIAVIEMKAMELASEK